MNITLQDAAVIAQLTSSTILVATAFMVWIQIREVRRSTYATAFKTIYDILQDEEVRKQRGHVMNELAEKDYSSWTAADVKAAEKVCHTYDSVGIMCRNGMIPTKIIVDSWANSLQTTWKILRPLIEDYRETRNFNRHWDDFQWLAKKAKNFQRENQDSVN